MFRLFQTIRQGLIVRKDGSSYLLYAGGEILLVVLGILIALQIDNWNDQRKEDARERQYLHNIRDDLVNNIAEIDRFIADRTASVVGAGAIISHLEGGLTLSPHDFNNKDVQIYEWQRFSPINYTVGELIYSGNLALISNEAIKSSLLRLESANKASKAEGDHFRFDSEELLYKPIYAGLDLHPMLRDFMGEADALPPGYFDVYQTDPRFKNGLLMVILEFSKMNEQLAEMKEICEELIATIDAELGSMA